MLYLIFVPIHCWLYLYLAWGALPTTQEHLWYLRVYDTIQQDRLLSFTLIQSFLFGVAMGLQTWQQVYFIFTNMTVNEAINGDRYPYFWDEGKFKNPFSRGPFQNLKDFLSPVVDYRDVFYVHQLPPIIGKWNAQSTVTEIEGV
eukprot:TRINITY_DN6189_c0_g1_i2.p1 TRINITY_DN6189_c0_g1~~TRINITY_DN6189_c0_g1_i2.p1  ORF type:complete len:144 (-),score=31.02 TRINITY_DN6189_c0_g1_i2:74-505(-)